MGAFKLGKMTFGSLFKKPETVMYPLETKPQPKGLKGHVVIDPPTCILCGMCDRSCTTNCITVDRKARTWSIDPFACVQCGYCITVCPKDSLSMDPNYSPAATGKASNVVEIPEQPKGRGEAIAGDAGAKAAPKPVRESGAGEAKASEGDELAAPGRVDEQLERLLGQMDATKADKVKTALA